MAAAAIIQGGLGALPQAAIMISMFAGRPYAYIRNMRKQLLDYKAIFTLSRDISQPLSRSASPMLQELGRALSVDNPASDGPGLSGLSESFKRMRGTVAMALPDFAWFHGAKTLPFVQVRIQAKQVELARLFGAISEIDALRSLTLYGEGLGARATKPVVKEGSAPALKIQDGQHPFLASKDRSVGNDFDLNLELDAAGGINFGVLTGSNMGGKSTYLRTAALLAILAQAGALVPAAAYMATAFKILSSIDIRDHLASGKSLYDAETDRVLALIREAEKGGYFMIMDEILQGTNPEESTAAQWAIVRHLARTRNLFYLATHNPKITELAGVESGIANFHVEESLKDGQMTFSHKVLPGPAVSRNGLLTLKLKGFPKSVLDEARAIVDRLKKY